MDSTEFERLFDAHAQNLFAFLVYRTGDRALAEDVLSDTFERAFRSRGRYRSDLGSQTNWLYSIALNRLRDLHRRSESEAKALSSLEPADGIVESFEDRVLASDELQEALRELPEAEREAIALRFGAGLTVPEVARVLGEPLPKIEGRVYRGLNKMRERLLRESEAGPGPE